MPAPGEKLRGARKMEKLRVKFEPTPRNRRLPKPRWIRAPFPGGAEVTRLKKILRENRLHTVCEEARCPNLGECFANGTATFMVMGDICTRRCPFCDVAHGRPLPLDSDEPHNLARTITRMGLSYAVITSVDRDDLRDGGAAHFVACINAIHERCPGVRIETLVPDFRGRLDKALAILVTAPPDVFNHNLESVPRLYPRIRPGADYRHSLKLLQTFKARQPQTLSKSGLMLGLGETIAEVAAVMEDLRAHDVDMVTLGQYLQPGPDHLPVERYVAPQEFNELRLQGEAHGFPQRRLGADGALFIPR